MPHTHECSSNNNPKTLDIIIKHCLMSTSTSDTNTCILLLKGLNVAC